MHMYCAYVKGNSAGQVCRLRHASDIPEQSLTLLLFKLPKGKFAFIY